ncbi:NADH-quinone oxidoreductase subunit NuoE [Lyticum sinuosum]|uniref:NADH-quinone oxidoreductase subunit E n=1 Tax=Lyticum sinuosum TaxID=1332059 RepID=A0AAE4VMC9_9RICK|nr:NAD(P)H-dependent oxidoreductase subunit E [Lyticum sinuosum]MDZ5761621.1 NADH-quinone oxidoreductase subunit E [Lyticum sinuosum]
MALINDNKININLNLCNKNKIFTENNNEILIKYQETSSINSKYDVAENAFSFSEENLKEVSKILSKYPLEYKRSAIMPLLHLAQKQNNGWISYPIVEYISNIVGIPAIKILEIVNFYTMYNIRPTGEYLLQVCRTMPCWLCGAEEILKACKDILGIEIGMNTPDGVFSLREVECLGICIKSPVLQVNYDNYENLDYQKTVNLLLFLYKNI